MRFPKGRRLTRRGDFLRVREQGQSYQGHFLVLGVLQDPEIRGLKVGYVTTRRIGGAAVRVRVRRRLRAILQRTGERLRQGYALVIVPRRSAADASSQALEKEWKWLAHRAKLFQESQPAGS